MRQFLDVARRDRDVGRGTFGLSLWAHHLTSAQRNGTDGLYSSFSRLRVRGRGDDRTLGRTGVAIASRIDFTPRELRWESGFAFGVSLSSLVVIASTSVWWIQMGLHAPWFLEGTSRGVAASPGFGATRRDHGSHGAGHPD